MPFLQAGYNHLGLMTRYGGDMIYVKFSKVKNAKDGTVVANFLIQERISYFGI